MSSNNTVTAPKGFLASGVKCGIKKSGKHDLGLIVCPAGAKAAAVFTTNKITSAAVQISKKHAKSDAIYGVVVNSGNANACTGKRGLHNAVRMCAETAGYRGYRRGDRGVVGFSYSGDEFYKGDNDNRYEGQDGLSAD